MGVAYGEALMKGGRAFLSIVQRLRMLVSLRFCGFQKGVLLECGI